MLPDGFVLENRYRIIRRLSQGGMGAVYLAEDRNLASSLCAVKQTLELGAEIQEYVNRRFQEEMQVLARLKHPSIPNVRDFFQVEQGCFLVMDYIEGKTLEQELAAHRERGTHFTNQAAAADLIPVLKVLQYLHSRQPLVLHRDIKPANLIRESSSGQLMVVDFGLARAPCDQNSHTSVGTLGYSAVEQLSGKPEVASDLYSVGATLAEMLTGIRPTLAGVEPLTRENMPDYDAALAQVVNRATLQNPKERYASAEQMLQALQLAENSPLVLPEQTSYNPPPPRRFPWLPLTLGLAMALLLAWNFALPKAPVASADPGLPGPLFRSRQDGKSWGVGLGEDVGLVWAQREDSAASEKKARLVVERLNFLYHYQCQRCGSFLLEPEGVKVGRYKKGKVNEKVVFYAHLHGQEYAYGPELLTTLDPKLAVRLGSSPRYAAGYWRDVLRDVVTLSRGRQAQRTSLGKAFRPVVERLRRSAGNNLTLELRTIVSGLNSKEARTLHEAFRHVPDDFQFEADVFPPRNGFEPLSN